MGCPPNCEGLFPRKRFQNEALVVFEPSKRKLRHPGITGVFPGQHFEVPLHRERKNEHRVERPPNPFGQRGVTHTRHHQANAEMPPSHRQRAQLILGLGAQDDVVDENKNGTLLLETFLLFEQFGNERLVPLRKEKPWIPKTLQQRLEDGVAVRGAHKTQYQINP